MGDIIYLLMLTICGIVLLGLGYFMFFGKLSPIYPYLPWGTKAGSSDEPGKSKSCPVCRYKLEKGELVKTFVYPTSSKNKDRMVHIRGCSRCLVNNEIQRRCPVCKSSLLVEDYLVSRMFERAFSKNHVHVLGCNHCRKPRKLDR